MRLTNQARLLVCALGALSCQPAAEARGQPANDPLEAERRAEADDRLLLVRIHGELTRDGTAALGAELERTLDGDSRVRYVAFELDSPGGDLEAAVELKEIILQRLKSRITVAYVPDNGAAYAEALLVALSARHLFVGRGSRLGADPARKADPAAEQKLVAPLRDAARERGHPQYLADAMAAGEHPDVYFVIERKTPQAEDKKVFYSGADLEDRKRPGNRPASSTEPELVARSGERLTLAAADAIRFGLARAAGSLDGVREALPLTLPQQNIIELWRGPLQASSPGAQKVVDVLNHSVVRFLILLFACLAALVEIKTAGSFIAGAVSVTLFGVFFLAASFPTTGSVQGTASLWEVILFAVGLALVAVEFLLLPGMGIFAISGAALCGISLVLAMVPPSTAQIAGSGTRTDAVIDALAVLAYGFGAGGVFFVVILKLFSRHSAIAGRGLVTTTAITGVATADSALDAQAQEMLLLDREGAAQTLLRPAGKVELDDGRLLDVVTDGELLEKGTRVRVVSSSGGIIKVARIDGSRER